MFFHGGVCFRGGNKQGLSERGRQALLLGRYELPASGGGSGKFFTH